MKMLSYLICVLCVSLFLKQLTFSRLWKKLVFNFFRSTRICIFLFHVKFPFELLSKLYFHATTVYLSHWLSSLMYAQCLTKTVQPSYPSSYLFNFQIMTLFLHVLSFLTNCLLSVLPCNPSLGVIYFQVNELSITSSRINYAMISQLDTYLSVISCNHVSIF